MERLKLNDIHPFVRKVGEAVGLVHSLFIGSYDYRLIFFCNGGKIWLEDKEHKLSTGDTVIISPGRKYRVVLDKNQQITVVNFDLTTENCSFCDKVLSDPADKFDRNKIINKNAGAGFMAECGYMIKNADEAVFKLCEKMSRIYFDADENAELKMFLLSGMLMEIIGRLLRSENRKNEKSQMIYRFICRNFRENISLDDLAERFNYHKTYINRLLKKDYNVCFKQLVIDLRLNHSLILLEETDMSLVEISESLGFYDSKHFGHSFKKRFGINPSEYRK